MNNLMPLTNNESEFVKSLFGLNNRLDSKEIAEIVSANVKEAFSELAIVLREQNMFYKEQTASIIDAINTATISAKSIAENIKESGNKDRRQLAAFNRTNVIFNSLFTEDEHTAWVNETFKSVVKYAGLIGKKPQEVFDIVFEKMKDDKYDVEKLFEDYVRKYPHKTRLDMISESDVLRLSFKYHFNELVHEYKYSKYSNAKIIYTVSAKEAGRCPDEVKSIIAKLSSTGVPSGRHFEKAKKILSKDKSINIKRIKRDVCKRYKINTCSTWFAVSQSPEALEVLRSAIEEK